VIRRGLHLLLRAVAGTIAGLAVLAVLGIWRLSTGPVSLPFATGWVEDLAAAAADNSDLSWRVGSVVLKWAGWDGAFDLRFVDVAARDSTGRIVAWAPELALTLSHEALLEGRVAPSELALFHPTLRLARAADGSLSLSLAGSDGDGEPHDLRRLAGALMSGGDGPGSLAYLDRLDIVDADLVIHDATTGASWRAPASQVTVHRRGDGVRGEVALVLNAGGETADVAVIGDWHADGGGLDLGISVEGLRPAAFARLSPSFRALDGLDVALRGTVTVAVDSTGAVSAVGADLAGDGGHVALPVSIAQDLGLLSWAQRVAIDGVVVRGHYDGASRRLEVAEFSVDAAPDVAVYVPAPADQEIAIDHIRGRGRVALDGPLVEVDDLVVDLGDEGSIWLLEPVAHRMPLRSVRASLRFDGAAGWAKAFVTEADLRGPKVTASALVTGIGAKPAIDLTGTLRDLPVDAFGTYWPPTLGPGAQSWAVSRLSGGQVDEGRVSIALRTDGDGGLEVTSLDGTLAAQGVTVDYLPPMPKVTNASATARFGPDRVTLTIIGGEAEGLVVGGGTIDFSDLGRKDLTAIDLLIEGPVERALALIDHEPLGYASALGLQPDLTAGQAKVQLSLAFPALKDLTLAQVEVHAEADVRDVRIGDVVADLDITDGRLAIQVDKAGMDVSGRVTLETVTGDLTWRRNFDPEAPELSRLDVSVPTADIANAKDVGLHVAPVFLDMVEGTLAATIRFTEFDERTSQFATHIDLSRTTLQVPQLGWAKPPQAPATAELLLRLIDGRIERIPRFALSAAGLSLSGSAGYGIDGDVQWINVERLASGRTDLAATLVPQADGWEVTARGSSFDLQPTMDRMGEDDGPRPDTTANGAANGAAGDTADEPKDPGPDLWVSAEVGTVWTGPDRRLDAVNGRFERRGGLWRRVAARARLGSEDSLVVALEPGAEGADAVVVRASDAGQALRALGVFDNIVGGELELDGRLNGASSAKRFVGNLKIADYRVVDAPLLAHVLNVLALTGIVDSLSGEGLSFSRLDAAVTLDDGILHITDAAASGVSLGFTASGSVDTATDTVDLAGTVVPAYALNSALGYVPVLGPLFTGGEEGGGVFAATYSIDGTLDEPEVSVNPLTALAPGFLRKVFGIFDGVPVESDLDILPAGRDDTDR